MYRPDAAFISPLSGGGEQRFYGIFILKRRVLCFMLIPESKKKVQKAEHRLKMFTEQEALTA